jgi:hypothetical protein
VGRFTAGLFASGALLFLSGAVGLVASWGLVAGVGFLAAGGIAFAIVAEDKELHAASRPAVPETPVFDPAP